MIKSISFILMFCMQSAFIYCNASLEQWNSLIKSNKNFVKNHVFKKQRRSLKHEQNPPIIVLSCSDSRVPPEHIFDKKLG
jgi:carbonic anhydrase